MNEDIKQKAEYCLNCKVKSCSNKGCPLNNNIPEFIQAIKQEEYQKAYNEAYNDYLRKMGFEVEEPWTFARIRRLIIGLFVITCICILIWMLPPTRALLVQLYEENFIIKTLVDITIKFINIIINMFE